MNQEIDITKEQEIEKEGLFIVYEVNSGNTQIISQKQRDTLMFDLKERKSEFIEIDNLCFARKTISKIVPFSENIKNELRLKLGQFPCGKCRKWHLRGECKYENNY